MSPLHGSRSTLSETAYLIVAMTKDLEKAKNYALSAAKTLQDLCDLKAPEANDLSDLQGKCQ